MSKPVLRPRRTREEQTKATRSALMNAAMRIVARHGYARASVSRITEEAGVAQGTIYSYFETHQQLLEELLPTVGVELLRVLGKEAQGTGDYFEHERRSFLAFFKYLRTNPHFLRILTEAEVAAPASHSQHMSNVEDRYVAALQRGLRSGQLRDQDDKAFRVLAEVLSGARGHIAHGLDALGRSKKLKISPQQASETFVRFLKFGLGPTTTDAKRAPALPREKRSRKAPQSTRERLLRVAARLIYENGYDATTVAGVTGEAKVGIGTFYANFSSRDEMLKEVLAYVREDMLDYINHSIACAETFLEVEQRSFVAFFEHLNREPWFVRIETEAAVWIPEAYFDHIRDLSERYVDSMEHGKAAGQLASFSSHELPILSFIFMAARHYLATRYVVRGKRPARLPAYARDAYFALLANGLAPLQD